MEDQPVLFVGDIQGCAGELASLLERAGFHSGRHRLIPLGDTINRGPDAPGVLDILEQAGAEPILGNHEMGLLEVWRTGVVPVWARNPHTAYAQLHAAGRWESAMARIATWPLIREGRDWIAVHAGIHPTLAPQDTDPRFLTEVRYCDQEGIQPHGAPKGQLTAPPGYAPWFEHYRGRRTVLFGHWARLGLVMRPCLRGLDTGCVYGGSLTGLWWPADRLVQVKARKAYQPVEAPRTERKDALLSAD